MSQVCYIYIYCNITYITSNKVTTQYHHRNERSALSSTKSHFASSTHSGNGNDLSPFTGSTSASGKDVEQPISAKSMCSTSTSATGQSVPSYSSIWRPELPGAAMTSMTSAKYPVISNSGGYGFSRGKVHKYILPMLSNGQIETELGNRIYSLCIIFTANSDDCLLIVLYVVFRPLFYCSKITYK